LGAFVFLERMISRLAVCGRARDIQDLPGLRQGACPPKPGFGRRREPGGQGEACPRRGQDRTMIGKQDQVLAGTAPVLVALAPALSLPNVSRRLIGMPSSGNDGTCAERSRGSRAERRPKSRVSTPEVARRLTLFPAFLIANPRLETYVTSRKQTAATTSNREFLQVRVSRLHPPARPAEARRRRLTRRCISNRQIPRLEPNLTPAISIRTPFLIAEKPHIAYPLLFASIPDPADLPLHSLRTSSCARIPPNSPCKISRGGCK
jgi:hypothetical protein